MRLIDADKLKIDDLCDICNSADCANCFSDKAFEQWIASQPTAYDPDKIVEQLEQFQEFEKLTGIGYCPEIDVEDSDRSCLTSELGCGYCAFEKAIEIVKGGAL